MQAFRMQKTEKREFGLTFRAQTYQNKRQKAKSSGQWSVADGQLNAKADCLLLLTDHRPLTTDHFFTLLALKF
jgi:hypothetical protein